MLVTVMIGPPGSGKTTWLAQNRPLVEVCSADHFFMKSGVYRFDGARLGEAHGACLRKFVEALQSQRLVEMALGKSKGIAVDNTNLWVSVRAPYIALAQAYGAQVEIIRFVDVNPEEAAKRNLHSVSLEAIKKMAGKAEANPPHWPKETLIQPDWLSKIGNENEAY